MADEEQDSILLVEPEIAQQVSSFALDIGNSLAKVIYRSKKDYKDGKPTFTQGDTNVGRLRLALLPRFEPEALIRFIQDNVDRPEVTPTPTPVPATGAGTSVYRRQLEEALNIKLQQITEFDGFAAGLHFLQKNESLQLLCLEKNAEGEADGMEQLKQLMAFRANLDKVTDKKVRNLDPGEKDSQAGVTVNSVVPQNGYTSTDADGLEKPAKDESRCLLVVTGSGTAWLRVGETDPVRLLEASAMSGCTFVGLGRLLTRSNKTFSELLDLAKQGDYRKVDMLMNDSKSDTDDVYSTLFLSELPVCRFGKAMTNPEGDFKDADIVASLLDSICKELIRVTILVAQVNGLEKVYLAGNFVNNDQVRRIISRDLIIFSVKQNMPDIHFVRHGGFLGAIGAMMTDAMKPTDK